MAAGAPPALLLGVVAPQLWYLGLLWVPVVLTLLVADRLLAAAPPALEVECAGAVEIGSPLVVGIAIRTGSRWPRRLEIAVATGPRLRAAVDNRLIVGVGEERPSLAFVPVRRGTNSIERLWSRWTGPLGLVWRIRRQAVDRKILITPDIRPVRDSAQLLLRDAEASDAARIDRGEGSEFEALTEWRSGMERRSIDWKQSARHLKLVAREFGSSATTRSSSRSTWGE